MLKELFLKNYTLAKELHINFESGLNIISGESGAGKSVIIGAIDLLLGARASSEIIRFGEQKAIIEATFNISTQKTLHYFLEKMEYENSDELILRREIGTSGQNRVFINDTPASKSDLAVITENLIDLHGQHDHQRLLNPKSHVNFLDSLIKKQEIRKAHRILYRKIYEDLRNYKKLQKQLDSQNERKIQLEKEIDEISSANISVEDEADLKKEEKQLLSAEEILQSVAKAQSILSDDTASLSPFLLELKFQLEFLEKFEDEYSGLLKELKSVKTFFDETSFSLQQTQNNVELNPKRLEQVQERLYLYETLRRKYGNTIEEILDYLENIETELADSDSLEIKVKELENRILEELEQWENISAELSSERKIASEKAEKKILGIFSRLGMKNAELQVAFKENEKNLTFSDKKWAFYEIGKESIEFLVKTNTGNPFLSLVKTASGGELSRIMLAFKSMLAEKDKIPLLVFDEIDSGISGKISEAVGEEINKLAGFRQILCITHSPQIASKGSHHFKVEKKVIEDQTFTKISKLSIKERVEEISLLLSAGDRSENSRILAKEMLILNNKKIQSEIGE
jgi:DNA repair protein RecN (Recombination protein N)